MKRIYKAINEGLKSLLIDFGNTEIQKSANVNTDSLYKFVVGDYVYYNETYGYNNLYGSKAAICVNDHPGNELYVVINHILMKKYRTFGWAAYSSLLRNRTIKTTENGWINTQNIIKKYKNTDIGCTVIWNYLQPNEYIPSIEELKTIYLSCKINGIDLFNEIQASLSDSRLEYLWSSSLYPLNGNKNNRTLAYCMINGNQELCDKIDLMHSLVLLHLEKNINK